MYRMQLCFVAITLIAPSVGWSALRARAGDTPSKKTGTQFKLEALKGHVDSAAPLASQRRGPKDLPKAAKIAPLSSEEKLKLASLKSDDAPASTKALSSKTLTITDDWWPEVKASIWAHCPSYVDSRRLSFTSATDGESVHVSLYPAGNKALTAKRFVVDFKVHLLSKTSAEYEIDFPESHSSQKVTVAPGLHHLTLAGKIADISKGASFVLSCTSPKWVRKGKTQESCGALWDFDGCEVTLFD